MYMAMDMPAKKLHNTSKIGSDILMTKTFRNDFFDLAGKLKRKESFAFSRFSDGEMLIMQNKRLIIDTNVAYVHDHWGQGNWGPEEHKSFDPDKDGQLRDKLLEAFKHQQRNYYKGICCRCCVGEENWNWQFEHISREEPYLTWANLFLNGNYRIYMDYVVPLMKEYPVVMVCNKLAKLDKLPFHVVKDFRVGKNCHIADQSLISEIHRWVEENQIMGYLFLFSAASLTNLIIHDLYKNFPNNTYLDIGSTLNPMMDLNGWKGSRDYLRGYWMNEKNVLSEKLCVW